MAERWHEIENLYLFASELKPEERCAYLEKACGGDEALRREVESLLANEEVAPRFLETESPEQAGRRSEARIPAGTQIGPYAVVEFLRAGGMGEVYKALDTRLERPVAIKFLPRTFAADRLALDRFQREARAASALNHPRICTIHDVGDFQGRPFLVMEFLEGQSLRDRMAGESLPTMELLDLAIQICDALEAAHAKGIIHRDIKPGNIFITTGGQIKILDFGLAKRAVEPSVACPRTAPPREGQTATTVTETMLTRPGSIAGTIAYLSPEQARGEEVDARTDIYSFGVVLYEMVTGRTPFRRESAGELIEAILTEVPVRPSLVKALPADLERIILKALARDRAARYQSIGEMLADLCRLQQAKPRWFRTVPLALAAALVVVSVIGVIVSRRTRAIDGVPNLVQRQVTANPNNDSVYMAALSPDGKQLAYTDLEGVQIRMLDTGEVHTMTVPPGICFR